MRCSIAIRAALPSDVMDILALAVGSAAIGQWTARQYLEAIESSEEFVERRVWVAETNDGVVGFLAAMHVEGEGATELENILVCAPMRRRGVAAALCDVYLQWTREEGAGAMSLEVRESNAAAIALYESLGFCATGRRKDYYCHPAEDAVSMWKELEQ